MEFEIGKLALNPKRWYRVVQTVLYRSRYLTDRQPEYAIGVSLFAGWFSPRTGVRVPASEGLIAAIWHIRRHASHE